MPAASVLTATRHTSARELPDLIRTVVGRLIDLAEERGGAIGGPTVIYHGQVGWESDGPIEVCVPIGPDQRAHRIEAAHDELVTRVLPVAAPAASAYPDPANDEER